jgi:hypothetical protein
MSQIVDMYQQYLYTIGVLKDRHGLTMDVDHAHIHTFYKDKRPLFKLFYGAFEKDSDVKSIVVSFHLDLHHPEVINWYINIYNIHPLTQIHDSYYEDSNGEFYLGEDALMIRETFNTQDILQAWLEENDVEDTRMFVESKVVGRTRNLSQSFNSEAQKAEALEEFKKLGRPTEDDEGNIH